MKTRTKDESKVFGNFPDTFGVRSAHLTGLKMRRITRAVSLDRAAKQRDEVAPSQIESHSISHQPGPDCRISNWQWSVSGHSGILQPLLVLPTREGDRSLATHSAQRTRRSRDVRGRARGIHGMLVLTRLHLFTLEHVAGRDVKPARTRLHQLIAGDREAIHVAAAG